MYCNYPRLPNFLGGDINFPDPPRDVASMVHCTYFFTFMENERLKHVDLLKDMTTVVSDRFTPRSSMAFYYLRYQIGAINADDYALGIQLCSKIFRDNLHLPKSSFKYKFLLFNIDSETDFIKRLERGSRITDFKSWTNFRWTFELYQRLLPKDTAIVSSSSMPIEGRENQNKEALLSLLEAKYFTPEDIDKPNLSDDQLQTAINRYISPKEIAAIQQCVQGMVLN